MKKFIFDHANVLDNLSMHIHRFAKNMQDLSSKQIA